MMRSSIEKICSFYKERKCARKICIVFVTLTVGPILMVLNLFRQKSQFKNGGSGPPEMKVWGPRPIPPPVPPPMVIPIMVFKFEGKGI